MVSDGLTSVFVWTSTTIMMSSGIPFIWDVCLAVYNFPLWSSKFIIIFGNTCVHYKSRMFYRLNFVAMFHAVSFIRPTSQYVLPHESRLQWSKIFDAFQVDTLYTHILAKEQNQKRQIISDICQLWCCRILNISLDHGLYHRCDIYFENGLVVHSAFRQHTHPGNPIHHTVC